MNSREEVIIGLFLTFKEVGQVSYKQVYNISKIYQSDIKKYFGNLKNACEQLEISIEKNKFKSVKCSSCNKDLKISKYSSSIDKFKHFCNECKEIEEIKEYNKQFLGLKEDFDYLVCPKCGFKTRTLEAHFRKTNKTWSTCKFSKEEVEEEFGKFQRIYAPILDKKSKNKRKENGWYKNSLVTKEKMKKSGGKHCLGKTKENCEYIKKLSEIKKQGFSTGKYDTRKYKVSKEQLEETKLEDGKINPKISSENLNIPIHIVYRLCNNFGVEISRKWVNQTFILKTISSILKESFIEEFSFPKSKFRYDGCFLKSKLLVEVNGYQHYIFPNFFHKTIEAFEKNKERDLQKISLAQNKGYKILIISYKD